MHISFKPSCLLYLKDVLSWTAAQFTGTQFGLVFLFGCLVVLFWFCYTFHRFQRKTGLKMLPIYSQWKQLSQLNWFHSPNQRCTVCFEKYCMILLKFQSVAAEIAAQTLFGQSREELIHSDAQKLLFQVSACALPK